MTICSIGGQKNGTAGQVQVGTNAKGIRLWNDVKPFFKLVSLDHFIPKRRPESVIVVSR